MASKVMNPTNAPPRPHAAVPFIRRASETAKISVQPKDSFNTGKEYADEAFPLLTTDGNIGTTKKSYPPSVAISNALISPPTKEEMDALARPDETSQTQLRYIKEAVVMDVDAKLITSTVTQMKNGIFREAHYPTLSEYMKSQHYLRMREARLITERLSGMTTGTKLREGGGIRLNPNLIQAFKNADTAILKRLKESGVTRELVKLQKDLNPGRKLKEDSFTLDNATTSNVSPNWDGGQSSSAGGRELDFVPLIQGPYNKQLYWMDYLDMQSKAFDAATHNPVAKRILKVITQFVLGKGVKLTVVGATRKSEMDATPVSSIQNLRQLALKDPAAQPKDYKAVCQKELDLHWVKNTMHIRSKQIMKDLLTFGEQFIRYYDAPWGLKLRQIDPSTIMEVVTDPDDCENEFYVHQQYSTRYQWMVDLPIPTIKFIIRQVPSAHYYHMKINSTSGEVRGRSELFAILGWLKRLKEWASDRVVRNKMANLFVLDVAVEGDAAAVAQVQQQFSTPPTTGSFFIHNKAAEIKGIAAEIGAGDVQGDWEMFLTIIAMGAGISQEYLGMSTSGGKASALVGTEPDIKTFEDYQEMMEAFFLQDSERLFTRAKEQKKIPDDLAIVVEVTYPALATEDRSEKLKDLAFMESMSWVSHRRVASAAAKEMQFTSYDYDHEQKAIAEEDAQKEMLINNAYAQVTKGADSAPSPAGGAATPGATGASGKGASGMGMGKQGTPTPPKAAPAKASVGESKNFEWRKKNVNESGVVDNYSGRDPRDVASAIKREATNLRYERREIGRRQDRTQTPDKVRDQKTMDRGQITDARRALKSGNLNHESEEGGPGSGRHKEFDSRLQALGYKHQGYWGDNKAGTKAHHYHNEKSDRTVSVDSKGNWESKRGTWGASEKGHSPEEFFSKFHTKKKESIQRFPRK